MARRTTIGPTAEHFVEVTLELIAERGGSTGVNLREISRRVGCAHTNAYNYFSGLDDLLWVAYHRTVDLYARHIVQGLDATLASGEYFRRLVTNLASFPQENPGLYRFIGTDPIDIDAIPADTLAAVARVKDWMFAAFRAVGGPGMTTREADDFCNITYGYIDGETLNYIHGRVVPGEDIPGRIVANAMRLYALLTGRDLDDPSPSIPAYPVLRLDGPEWEAEPSEQGVSA